VVGVGASAGGLEAFGQLLASLPPTTGVAFVLVQHLDPKHPSALAALLSPRTSLTVTEAAPDVVVERDHVYVIPPNVTLTISGGRLRLAPRAAGGTPHLPIDDLLSSLANDRGARAIGVILSGTGSDGTRGIEAIKAAGGLTYAQDDATAKYTAMPRHAVQSGCIDRVLSPEGIAHEIVHVVTHPMLRAAADDEATAEAADDLELSRVVALLQAIHGVDFGAYRKSTLRRRITRRLVLLRIGGYADYVHRLSEDRAELEALYNDVLINVTRFFRDAEVFDALGRTVFPDLLRHKEPDAPVRMWVPGCSTGQEAYSLVIALLECLEEQRVGPRRIQVFATDLSTPHCERRARGCTPTPSRQEVSAERLQRFFTRADGGYRVVKALREAVVFARHDIAGRSPLLPHGPGQLSQPADLPRARRARRVLSTVHYALELGGVLLLGSAETVGAAQDLFSPVDLLHRVYTRRAAITRYPHFRGGRHPESLSRAPRVGSGSGLAPGGGSRGPVRLGACRDPRRR
jgi:two-component system CheB/CheR fusion protein